MSVDELKDCHKYKLVVEELQPLNRGSNISGGCLVWKLQLLAVRSFYVLLGFFDPRTRLLG